jgi:AraC-like DNA-binding protein
MESHAAQAITIADVVEECACSRRPLFEAFLEHRGYTPMQFLANVRLDLAREALAGQELSGAPGKCLLATCDLQDSQSGPSESSWVALD